MRVRPRRNRKNELIRKMVEETVLRPANLIYPLFLLEGDLEKQAIDSLPGIFRMNLNDLFLASSRHWRASDITILINEVKIA